MRPPSDLTESGADLRVGSHYPQNKPPRARSLASLTCGRSPMSLAAVESDWPKVWIVVRVAVARLMHRGKLVAG